MLLIQNRVRYRQDWCLTCLTALIIYLALYFEDADTLACPVQLPEAATLGYVVNLAGTSGPSTI